MLPTLTALRDAGARVVVMSHLGRPKGAPDPKYSLAPVAAADDRAARRARSAFAADTVGESADGRRGGARRRRRAAAGEPPVQRRARPARTTPSGRTFAARAGRVRLTPMSTTRSAPCTASTPASTTCRGCCRTYAGGLVLREIEVLARLTEEPRAPVRGGARRRQGLRQARRHRGAAAQVDRLLIGGGMCFTFLKAQGHEVGTSLLEEEHGRHLPGAARAGGGKIVLPTDIVAATGFAADADHRGRRGRRDPGRPARAWTSAPTRRRRSPPRWPVPVPCSGTARWACSSWSRSRSAPVGWPRQSPRWTASRSSGGGDSAAAVRALGHCRDAFGHISTGGGASLEYLEGKTLPGLAALEGCG